MNIKYVLGGLLLLTSSSSVLSLDLNGYCQAKYPSSGGSGYPYGVSGGGAGYASKQEENAFGLRCKVDANLYAIDMNEVCAQQEGCGKAVYSDINNPWSWSCDCAGSSSNLSVREKASLVLAPLVVKADIHFGTDSRLNINVGVASYTDKDNAEITVRIVDSSKTTVLDKAYGSNQISQQTGSFTGAGRFDNTTDQNLLTVNDSVSLSNSNVAFARVFFKNKSACKLFGETDKACNPISAYIANISNIGTANSLQSGEIRFISINPSLSY